TWRPRRERLPETLHPSRSGARGDSLRAGPNPLQLCPAAYLRAAGTTVVNENHAKKAAPGATPPHHVRPRARAGRWAQRLVEHGLPPRWLGYRRVRKVPFEDYLRT